MPPGRRARQSPRRLFKGARLAAPARLALNVKLARLSEEECREVLDYIEIMESSRAVVEGPHASSVDSSAPASLCLRRRT
jgi:hypothetical protein